MENVLVNELPISSPYTHLLTPLSSENPLFLIQQTEYVKTLPEINGKILVDNIFRFGNTSKRFFELSYATGKINLESVVYIELDRKNSIRITANTILQEVPNVVNNSILNSAQKKLILHGVSI
ncbi:type II toxin-antitoxin system RnlB family antitoxin [Lysinibacillus fusiformis]|uniref:type II toxin-antitoxin system RnlB family antitoxin n=1 Tax=Lysinibacillus fusiformis TaxID=28031 RepID=UPI003D019FDD